MASPMENAFSTIGDAYVREEDDRPNLVEERERAKTLAVPVIDMANLAAGHPERQRTMQAMDEACREWGFFQVINHGVPSELIAEYQALTEAIFSLPPEELSETFSFDESVHPSVGKLRSVGADAFLKKLDWRQSLVHRFFDDWESASGSWPSQLPGYKEILLKYKVATGKLLEGLLEAMSENLGLEPNHLNDHFGRDYGPDVLLMNCYPPCPQPDLALGMAGHTDPSILTAVFQDDVGGLQVKKDGQWVALDPVPGAYVINIGDSLQALTNGIYQSVEHRGVVNTQKQRISLPAFHKPKADCLISPAPGLVTAERPALYRDFTFGEFDALFRSQRRGGITAILQHFLRQ